MNDEPKPEPKPLVNIDFGHSRGKDGREESLLIRITAKPGFGAFFNAITADPLPGWPWLKHTPLAPMIRMAALMMMPVTAMVAPNAIRLTIEPPEVPKVDLSKVKGKKKKPKASEGFSGPSEDAKFTVIKKD